MFLEQTLLPRCQYGVPVPTEEGVGDCGDPAIAKWNWSGEDFFVCEHHNLLIEKAEESFEDFEENSSRTS
jgi:hypothetical protein